MTRFPAANIGFHQGTPVVPRRFLPTHAAMFGNRLQMPVTRSGHILGRLARHATRTRWHNDRCIGMAGSDLAIDAVLVICTIAGQRSDGIINLVEQGTDLRAVIDIIGGQRRRDDPAGVGIDTDVQFAPRPASVRAPSRAAVASLTPLLGSTYRRATCSGFWSGLERSTSASGSRPASRAILAFVRR